MNLYDLPGFVEAVANKTRTPVLAIKTDASCASSLRYLDIVINEEVLDELRENECAFVTYDSAEEAIEAFDGIADNYPLSSTLSIQMILAVPGNSPRVFERIHGVA